MAQIDSKFDVIDEVEVPPMLTKVVGRLIPAYKLGENQAKALQRHLDSIEQALRLVRLSKRRLKHL